MFLYIHTIQSDYKSLCICVHRLNRLKSTKTKMVRLYIYIYICYICVYVLVTWLCVTLCDPMDGSLPGSSVHGILQAGIPEWLAISFSNYIYSLTTQCVCIYIYTHTYMQCVCMYIYVHAYMFHKKVYIYRTKCYFLRK